MSGLELYAAAPGVIVVWLTVKQAHRDCPIKRQWRFDPALRS